MIITIGGNIGAGKTTLASRLAKALDYEELYTGHIFREMAREKGISIEEFYAALKNDPAVDKEVDARQADLMRTRDNFVIQGRISWHFAKASPFRTFNIFLKVDPAIGAARSGKRTENAGREMKEMIAANAEREQVERDRYKKLYGVEDFQAPEHYDYILDTTDLDEEEVLENILAQIKTKTAA
jgi:predicted cytidylate kinase